MAAKARSLPLRELFASNLRAERARLGLTQEKLAEMVKVHPTYVSRVEMGQYSVGIDKIEKFAEALGIAPEILLMAPAGRSRH